MKSSGITHGAHRIVWTCCFAVVAGLAVSAMTGCLSVAIDEPLVDTGGRSDRRPIDTSRVPPTSSHEEARQKIAEAYARIDVLNRRLSKLTADKAELKAELKTAKKQRDEYEKYQEKNEDYKRKYKECKEDLEELKDKHKKLKKSLDD